MLARINDRHHRDLRLSPDAVRALHGYAWPGNVRELENALEFAVAVTRGQTILPGNLPEEIVAGGSVAVDPAPADAEPLDERGRIQAALEAHRWRRAATAEALGISRATLWRKMREFGLS